MSVSTLQYWLRRARSLTEEEPCKAGNAVAAPAISLLEVELAAAPPASMGGRAVYEIEWSSAVRLRVPGGFAPDDVRRLIALLRESL